MHNYRPGEVVSLAKYRAAVEEDNRQCKFDWEMSSMVPLYGKVSWIDGEHIAVKFKDRSGCVLFAIPWLMPLSPIEQLAFLDEEF